MCLRSDSFLYQALNGDEIIVDVNHQVCASLPDNTAGITLP